MGNLLEIIDKFKKLDTTCVSDALDRLGIQGRPRLKSWAC